jgi:hypothetical protein
MGRSSHDFRGRGGLVLINSVLQGGFITTTPPFSNFFVVFFQELDIKMGVEVKWLIMWERIVPL